MRHVETPRISHDILTHMPLGIVTKKRIDTPRSPRNYIVFIARRSPARTHFRCVSGLHREKWKRPADVESTRQFAAAAFEISERARSQALFELWPLRKYAQGRKKMEPSVHKRDKYHIFCTSSHICADSLTGESHL